MPGRKTESVWHLCYESALAKTLVFSSKYFHLLVFTFFSTNTSIMVQHNNSSSITNMISWLETTHWINFFVCHIASPGEQSPASSKASFVSPGYYSSVDTAPSPGIFLSMVTYSKSGWFLTGKPLFWQFAASCERKILHTVSVPFLAQLHPKQDLG